MGGLVKNSRKRGDGWEHDSDGGNNRGGGGSGLGAGDDGGGDRDKPWGAGSGLASGDRPVLGEDDWTERGPAHNPNSPVDKDKNKPSPGLGGGGKDDVQSMPQAPDIKYGVNVNFDRDMFNQIDYNSTRNKYAGSRTENYDIYTGHRSNGNQTRTRKSQAGVNQEAIDAAQEADTGYAARQQALLANNGQTSNISTVHSGEDLNIGSSSAPDVGASGGKKRRQGKGGMSATLGIS